MRNVFFILLVFFSSLSIAAPQSIEMEFPAIAFDETKAAVYFDVLPTPETSTLIQVLDGNHFDTITIAEVDGRFMVEPTFFLEKEVQFKNVEISKPSTSVIPLWTSILPPLIAIFLALIFKEVIFSLISGIFIGSAIIGFYAKGFIGIFTGFFTVIDTYIIGALNDSGHLSVIVFSILIGGIVAIISRNGGMQGIVNRISKYANNVRNGQFATWFLGIAIFFDDYANTLVVGNTMRPVTDRLKISREKLAYIVDSTAAPVSAIAFVTTWIGAELGYISSGVEAINASGTVINEGVYGIFLNSLAYSFYPILTLFFMFYLILRQKDFGPMLKAERRARVGGVINPEVNNADLTEIEDLQPVKGIKHRAVNAVLPVAVIVFGTMIGLLFTGFESLNAELLTSHPELSLQGWGDIWGSMSSLEGNPDGFTKKLGTLIGASDSYAALLWASLAALVLAIFLTVGQRIMKLEETVNTAVSGFKTMISAILILVLAWALAMVTDDMHTAEFLTGLIGDSIYPWLIPAFTFILAAVVAFSTGSSWSTMALVYPIILPAAWAISTSDTYAYEHADAMALFYNTVSAVLAGSVLGDHCSPISDTTILSSLASGSNHIDHVRTQIPYALTVGLISVVIGTILSSLGLNPFIGMLLGAGTIVLVIEVFGKSSNENIST